LREQGVDVSPTSLLLASDNAKFGDGQLQGWAVKTVVKQSNIPGAGSGRYADEAVGKDAVICYKPSVASAVVASLHEAKFNE